MTMCQSVSEALFIKLFKKGINIGITKTPTSDGLISLGAQPHLYALGSL